MSLFTRPASKSSQQSHKSNTSSQGSKLNRRQRCLSGAMFESLEGRQLFAGNSPIGPINPINPIKPILPPPVHQPTAAINAINKEYTKTATETDAEGNSVQADLGTPLSGVIEANGGGFKEVFQNNAAIYWSADTGAHVVYGAIGVEYFNIASNLDASGNSVQADLGLPTADEKSVSTGVRESTFTGGLIVWSAATGAHVVYGGIGSEYIALGGAKSWLGLPKDDESGALTDRHQEFQEGQIVWGHLL